MASAVGIDQSTQASTTSSDASFQFYLPGPLNKHSPVSASTVPKEGKGESLCPDSIVF